MNLYKKTTCGDELWNIKGDFGEFDAQVQCKNNSFYAENGIVEVKSEVIKYANGVCIRKGTVKNISNKEVLI